MPEILRKIPLQPLDSNHHHPRGVYFPQPQKPIPEKSKSPLCLTKPQFPAASTFKFNGIQCGSPALRSKNFCYFHNRIRYQRPDYDIPVLEDANSVQFAVMEVVRGLMEDQIDAKKAALVLYGLQIASINLKHVSFEPCWKDVVLEDPAEVRYEKKMQQVTAGKAPEMNVLDLLRERVKG